MGLFDFVFVIVCDAAVAAVATAVVVAGGLVAYVTRWIQLAMAKFVAVGTRIFFAVDQKLGNFRDDFVK